MCMNNEIDLLEPGSIHKKVFDDMVEIVIIKLCLLYTKQFPSGFKAEYNDFEKKEFSKYQVESLINDELFFKDCVDFFCWGFNTTNIIGNRPRMLLELYFFNEKFANFVNYHLYTSEYIYQFEDGSTWNLVKLGIKLRNKLEFTRNISSCVDSKSDEYKFHEIRAKYLLWQHLHKESLVKDEKDENQEDISDDKEQLEVVDFRPQYYRNAATAEDAVEHINLISHDYVIEISQVAAIDKETNFFDENKMCLFSINTNDYSLKFYKASKTPFYWVFDISKENDLLYGILE